MKITPLKIESEEQTKRLLAEIKVSSEGIKILSPKAVFAAFKIEGIKSWEANIIKQYLLSLGSDSAIERFALLKNIKTSTIIFGSISQLEKLCDKLKGQPFALKEISQKLSFYLNSVFKHDFIFKARNKILNIKRPVICGIINITPDSFSGDGLLRVQGSKFKVQSLVLKKVEEMVKNGAQIIDVGGESTRPFSKPVSKEEEIKRVVPAIKAIRKEFKQILISVDTYKFKVAGAVVDAGADIINDITALRKSPEISGLLRKYKLGCILMHMQGNPRTMQINPKYQNVVEDIIDFFSQRLQFCEKERIVREQLLLDPGIGFGKRVEDNFKIINELYKLKIFGLPIFIGLSRKSFIGNTLNVDTGNRIFGALSASVIAYIRGASILRVHDVKETTEVLNIASHILNN